MSKKAISSGIKDMRTGEIGQRLYAYWLRIRTDSISEDFEDYSDFYNWAMEEGYNVGDKLFRHDTAEPYSPDNCVWIPKKVDQITHRDSKREQLWDETVNRIRQYFGMEPIYSTEVSSG